ncbi:josephin-like protein [Gastrolobium bilobum]|uniref:josephin-like protein n=1 Tax=Gastrolobium bilobum TaxID=150636 RepID=UPI002AAFDC70|nr:josephin-like protein [Gastrolobium bilobum]
MTSQRSKIYHERQRLQFCLKHSLNSLFQEKMFTRGSLNAIAGKLARDGSNSRTWKPSFFIFKPHHNVFTGNYDANVLMAALEEKRKNVIWHDRRKESRSIDLDAPEDVLMGMVINVSVKKVAGIWSVRHWIALRKIDGVWYNLDSNLRAPEPFQGTDQVRIFLDHTIRHDGEIFLVRNE